MPFEEDDDDDETNNEQVDRHFNAGSSMPEVKWRITWSECCSLDCCALQHHLMSGCPQMMSSTN
jgi:hypothetical protein